MSELWKRILSSIAFAVLILGPLFWSPFAAFPIYGILGVLTYLEYIRLFRKTDHRPGWIFGAFIFLLIGLPFLGALTGFTTNLSMILVLATGCIVLGMAREVFRIPMNPSNLAIELFGAIYCGLGFWGMSYFFGLRDDFNQLWLPISVFLMIWMNDSMAYLFGRKIGRTPLIPKVSPKKTIEGSASGLVFTLLLGAGLSYIPGMPGLIEMLGMAAVTVVFGSLGDLFESTIKRSIGVKDSGRFLPGHGGFLDRFDAMLMAVPALIVYFELVLPNT